MSHGMPEHDRTTRAQAFVPLGTLAATDRLRARRPGWYPDPRDPFARAAVGRRRLWTPDVLSRRPVAAVGADVPAAGGAVGLSVAAEPTSAFDRVRRGLRPRLRPGRPGYAGRHARGPPLAMLSSGPAAGRSDRCRRRRVHPRARLRRTTPRAASTGGSQSSWDVIELAILVKGSGASASRGVTTSSDVAAVALLPFYLLSSVFTLPAARSDDFTTPVGSGWWFLHRLRADRVVRDARVHLRALGGRPQRLRSRTRLTSLRPANCRFPRPTDPGSDACWARTGGWIGASARAGRYEDGDGRGAEQAERHVAEQDPAYRTRACSTRTRAGPRGAR